MASTQIHAEVQKRYGSIAKSSGGGCGCSCGAGNSADEVSAAMGYSLDELSDAPKGANLGLGCGNPLALGSLKPGETVVDLGSGAGFDCFLAAKRVGPEGRVIGVDMTPEMLERARKNATKGGYTNVEFREGQIESLPLDAATADVIISNCVINLSPDKPQVFREAYRVLKPGGRIHVSDIVLLKGLPWWLRRSVGLYTACVGGALKKADYLAAIEAAGFREVTIAGETNYPLEVLEADPNLCPVIRALKWLPGINSIARQVVSLKVTAVK